MLSKAKAKDVLFVLTVDTEEEWDWDGEFPNQHCQVSNIQKLPEFHRHCQQLGIRPTYLTDYAVAANPESAQVICDILSHNDSELGAHLHPWSNPPYYGATGEFESHVVNLPFEQVEAKFKVLLDKLVEEFDRYPKSFRTGRWGVDDKVLSLLMSYGIETDSSVYPFYQNEFFSCQSSPVDSYWPDLNNPLKTGAQRDLLEVPVSVGFNFINFSLGEKLYRVFSESFLRHFRPIGLLWQLKLMRKLYLSPELCSADEMKGLVNILLKKEQPILHMYLHSSSLIDGVTGLLNTPDALSEICTRVSAVIEHLRQQEVNIKFCTLSEAKDILTVRHSGKRVLK